MKKEITILIICIVLMMSACGQSEATKAADAAISEIGDVSLESIEKIENAEQLVDHLSSKEYGKLRSIDTLKNARQTYETLFIEDLINHIGSISLESKDAINNARERYNSANLEIQNSVSNINLLVASEEQYKMLVIEEYVKPIEDSISSIGTVSLSSKNRINSAREKYEAADEYTKSLVSNSSILEEAEQKYENLVVKSIEDAINNIGTVSSRDNTKIVSARKKYDEADANIQSRVSNYSVLAEAEAEFVRLKIESIEDAINNIGEVTLNNKASINSARKSYDNAESEIQEKINNYDVLLAAEKEYERLKLEAEIEGIINRIDSIGKISLDSVNAIVSIEEDYNKLDVESKKKVTNYNMLLNAKEEYNLLLKSEYDSALLRMTKKNDEIRRVTYYIPSIMPVYMNSRCAVLPYLAEKGNNFYMKLRYNYAGNDWVFFKKVIIDIDGSQQYRSFSYFSINRDNAGWMVGELIDVDVDAKDIDMLRKIATSNKTVVRFEGDNYYHDYELTANDKSAIKDVLIIYDYNNK